MKLAIISDIHGNLPALERCLSILKKEKIDYFFVLGDVVNYGPWGNECVDLIESIPNTYKIIGNHENYFLNKKIKTNNDLVKNFFNITFSNFDRFDIIKNYKKKVIFKGIKFIHTINNKYIYSDTKVDIKENTVLGHSHEQYFKKINNFWILNPGSLGQNRKAINIMQFALFNIDKLRVKFFSEKYDFRKLINKMRLDGYPKKCIDYYTSRIKK